MIYTDYSQHIPKITASPMCTEIKNVSGIKLCFWFSHGLIFQVVYLKMRQLLGDGIPQTPHRGFAPGPHWGTSVHWGTWPPTPIGHTHLTRSYLLNKEPSPNCDHCRSPLTVEHILTSCSAYKNIREKYYHHSQLWCIYLTLPYHTGKTFYCLALRPPLMYFNQYL